eukprot:1399906-Pleurochrysis_carterae.AAC.2
MLTLRSVRPSSSPIHDAKASRRMSHSPVAVGVGCELRLPPASCTRCPRRHVRQYAVCVVVHGLRRKC